MSSNRLLYIDFRSREHCIVLLFRPISYFEAVIIATIPTNHANLTQINQSEVLPVAIVTFT